MRQIGLWAYSDSGVLEGLTAPDGSVIPFGLSGPFASMPDPTTVEPYTQYFVTDVGNYNGTRTFGSLWVTDGLTWVPVGGACCLWNHAAVVSLGTSLLAETLESSILLPAGLIRNNDSVEFKAVATRSGVTDAVTFRARLSPDMTIAGASFEWVQLALTGGSNRSYSGSLQYRRDNAGQVQLLGKDASAFAGGASSTAITITGTALTGQNLDAATYLHLTAQKAGTTDSGTLQHFEVNLYRR